MLVTYFITNRLFYFIKIHKSVRKKSCSSVFTLCVCLFICSFVCCIFVCVFVFRHSTTFIHKQADILALHVKTISLFLPCTHVNLRSYAPSLFYTIIFITGLQVNRSWKYIYFHNACVTIQCKVDPKKYLDLTPAWVRDQLLFNGILHCATIQFVCESDFLQLVGVLVLWGPHPSHHCQAKADLLVLFEYMYFFSTTLIYERKKKNYKEKHDIKIDLNL